MSPPRTQALPSHDRRVESEAPSYPPPSREISEPALEPEIAPRRRWNRARHVSDSSEI